MKKLRVLIPIAVLLAAILTYGFKSFYTNDSDQKTTYEIDVIVNDGDCALSTDCFNNVVITINGNAINFTPYVIGTSEYVFYTNIYPVTTVCATVTVNTDACPNASSTLVCDTISGLSRVIELEVDLSCN